MSRHTLSFHQRSKVELLTCGRCGAVHGRPGAREHIYVELRSCTACRARWPRVKQVFSPTASVSPPSSDHATRRKCRGQPQAALRHSNFTTVDDVTGTLRLSVETLALLPAIGILTICPNQQPVYNLGKKMMQFISEN